MKIRYSVATIHPKLGRLSLLCSEYIQVTGDLCRNYADENNQNISICFRKKFTSRSVKIGTCLQKLEKLKPEKPKLENWNLLTET